jgi:hypothetical protein
MKKGENVVIADDNDKVRTSVSRNRVTATLCTSELFLRAQLIYSSPLISGPGENVVGEWKEIKVSSTLGAIPAGFLPPS